MELLIEGIRSEFLFSVILCVIGSCLWFKRIGWQDTTLFGTENLPVRTQGGGSSVTCRTKTQDMLPIDAQSSGGNAMKPVYLSIKQEATGKRMKELFRKNGYSVKDVQEAMGFESPQAVYKWLSGRSLPSLDNFLILSRILHTSIEDILVVDGDFAFYIKLRTAASTLLTFVSRISPKP